MNSDKILMLCKQICFCDKTEIPQVIELMVHFEKFKMIELVDFRIELYNSLVDFDDELERLAPGENIICQLQELYKNNTDETKNLSKRITAVIHKVVYKNELLKNYISEFKKHKEQDVNCKGLEFLKGVYSGLGEMNPHAILVTRMLNRFWMDKGVSENELMGFEDK